MVVCVDPSLDHRLVGTASARQISRRYVRAGVPQRGHGGERPVGVEVGEPEGGRELFADAREGRGRLPGLCRPQPDVPGYEGAFGPAEPRMACLLYTSDAADEHRDV